VCEYGHNFEEKLIPDPVAQGILNADELPPLPANFHYDEPETMTHRVARRDDDCLIHWPILRRTRSWSELQWRSLAWNLYRLVEKVDAEIGMVLAALEATGHADDTLILFTADHGEAAGQHQMFQKFTLYEESARVPFIAACLGDGVELPKGGYDREHFISGVDVFPTVCDYAGVAPLPGLPGRSIRPLLEGDATAWRAHALVESNYWARAIITGRYKYVTEYRPRELEDYLPPGPGDAVLGLEQLFDLQHDPGETRNLAGDSGLTGVIADCRRRLAETERSLQRRPLRPGSPRTVVERWGSRLRQRWRQARGTGAEGVTDRGGAAT
jgi:arylsulfatase A-like enzyme